MEMGQAMEMKMEMTMEAEVESETKMEIQINPEELRAMGGFSSFPTARMARFQLMQIRL